MTVWHFQTICQTFLDSFIYFTFFIYLPLGQISPELFKYGYIKTTTHDFPQGFMCVFCVINNDTYLMMNALGIIIEFSILLLEANIKTKRPECMFLLLSMCPLTFWTFDSFADDWPYSLKNLHYKHVIDLEDLFAKIYATYFPLWYDITEKLFIVKVKVRNKTCIESLFRTNINNCKWFVIVNNSGTAWDQ